MVNSQNQTPADGAGDIAVIGLACRFPGASNADKFWELLSHKRSALCTVPESRYNVKAFHHEAREKLNTLSACKGHFLEQDVAAFDAPFFNITAQEAAAMDPTARMLLEVTYEAMENAGLPMERLVGSDTSCYVGCFTRDYHEMLMRDAETAPMYAGTGTGFSLLSNRISWFYDLRGPSLTLDTACSSSLVGLSLACQGLRSGESKIAIVCGANLILSPDLGMWLSNLRMTSTDGMSRSFADGTTGYGRGEGIATLILKPMRDALHDGDPIRAVIRGSGVNQDGHTTGITVPNREAQAELILSIYRNAGLDVSQTSYFEAHGTGTAVGDPLELGAVAQAISSTREVGDPLYVGSVKSNIGHLEGAAGLAGVIKCVLMLERGAILPNIHFERPNKRIPFASWKIEVPTEVVPWPQNRLQRASVNSFGYGGTNAHVILDNADQYLSNGEVPIGTRSEPSSPKAMKLFVFSAPAESALRRMLERASDYFAGKEEEDGKDTAYLDRLAYTLSDRRSQFPWKAAVVASSLSELKHSLTAPASFAHAPRKERLAFIFTGQGAQWAQMGLELCSYPVFRESLAGADEYLRSILGSEWSVLAELEKDTKISDINQARLSQPLCTVLQVAMVDLLASWNIEPMAVVGHSSGEIAAAYCCGALSREDAWTVAYFRGKVCGELSNDPTRVEGGMMAVGLSADAALEYIKEVKAGKVVVACVNSPSSVTVSGDAVGIEELQEKLAAAGIFHRRLQVEHAYHSHHMQRVADAYLEQVSSRLANKAPSQTAVQMVSSVTGTRITPGELGPSYWAQNLVSPVLFSDAVSTMLQDATRRRRRARAGESAVDMLLEIGPHGALKGPLRQILQHHSISTVNYASVLQRGDDAVQSAVRAAGELYVHGVPVSIAAVNRLTTKPRPLVDLPAYPWDHSLRYWAESRLSRNYRFRTFARHDLLGAPAADFSERQPRWRNILRVQEQPWLKDHVVHSSILFPASGSIVMVLEAVQQLTVDRQIDSIRLQQIQITKAIVIPNDSTGIEVVLQLHHNEALCNSRQDCWVFTVNSCSNGLTLEQNSSGMVTVRYASEKDSKGTGWTTGKGLIWQTARDQYDVACQLCPRVVSPDAFYKATHEAGLQYGPLFQGLTKISAGSDHCATVVKVTDTKTSMPGSIQSSHLIHPTTLDVIFHSMFTAMGGDNLDFQTAAVPIAFDSLIFYMNLPSAAGEELRSCCSIRRDGSRDLVADIYVSDMAWQEPKIIVNGIRCRELPARDTGHASRCLTKAPVGTLVWKPDLTLLDEARLTKYVADSLGNERTALATWENEVAIVVDLAAHKHPGISILQIGYSDALVNSLLSVLDHAPGQTPRCSSYTVLDADTETVSQCKETFKQQSDALAFDILDVEVLRENATWRETTFDLVIVRDGVLSREQLSQLQKYISSDGMLIVQKHLANGLPLPSSSYVNGHGATSLEESWTTLECSPTSSWSLQRRMQTVADSLDQDIVLIEPDQPDQNVQEISRQVSLYLANLGLRSDTVRWSSEVAGLHGKTVVSLLDLQSPFLPDISFEDYATLKALTLNSARLIWLAMGTDPRMQAGIGYLRAVQNENINLDLRYILLEQCSDRSSESIAQAIAPILVAPSTDREYTEVNGSLHINRWVNDNHLSSIMTSREQDEWIPMRLGAAKTPLRLLRPLAEATKPAVVFGAADDWPNSPAASQVEVEVKAVVVPSDNDRSVIQFSGVITKAGTACSRFNQGDRVWGCVLGDALQTHIHVNEAHCQLLPPETTFNDAADWALTLGTAHAALSDIARLREGNTVLIQGAASAIGQSAVQLAQREHAVVFVTVCSEEERRELETLGLDPAYILDDDDPDLEVAISGLTQQRGLDVVLNQSSAIGTLQTLWNCSTASGTLVDINPNSVSGANAGLSVAPLRRGASYKVFSAVNILGENLSRIQQLLDSVANLRPVELIRQPNSRTIWRASQAADAIQWAQSHTGRTAVLSFDTDDEIPVGADVANPLALDADATYLIVGGTGSLGANLAAFLARKGARHLAVVSRSGPASKNAEFFKKQLHAMGVRVGLYAADVGDEAAMRHVLEQCAKEMPPIRGVIQCAAVLDDAIYNNMTHEQWRNAIRPKIHGSWILHQLLPHDLQFFVMLSSIAGVVGNRSQANYAAGNTYQDALAHYRRRQGLPAVSVDLGLMLGIGLIAERGGATNLKKWEAVGIHEQEFHMLMAAAIAGSWSSRPLPAQVICGLPTGGILQSEGLERPFYYDDPRFGYLKRKDLDLGSDKKEANAAELLSSQLNNVQSIREAVDLITTALGQRLAAELQTDPENIDPSRPLHSYGVDSLLAVEIRNWILANLQAEVSLFDILSGGSIHALATRIAGLSKAIPDTADR